MSRSFVTFAERPSVTRETLEAKHRAALSERLEREARATRRRRLFVNCSFATGGLILFAVMYFR